jgi:hypothetical protein
MANPKVVMAALTNVKLNMVGFVLVTFLKSQNAYLDVETP